MTFALIESPPPDTLFFFFFKFYFPTASIGGINGRESSSRIESLMNVLVDLTAHDVAPGPSRWIAIMMPLLAEEFSSAVSNDEAKRKADTQLDAMSCLGHGRLLSPYEI